MRTILLSHNKTAYQKVMRAFKTSDRTCVVHPTGTGKSYLIAAVSESFKKVLILGPNTFVLDQVHSVLEWRDDSKKEKEYGPAPEYMTYSLLMYKEEVPADYDLICLDEFHRAGAPEWGEAVDRLLEKNPQAKVLGTTATPIRFLDDNRDMADELFEGNIASYMTLKDAWDRDILATPRFVTGLFEFDKVTADIEERISKSRRIDEKEKKVRLTRVNNLRLDWERSQGMPQIIRKHIDKDARRIIVFCGNVDKLKDMEQTVCGWFKKAGIKVACVYQMHAYMPDSELKAAMDGFESDDFGDGGVKLMMSVNMLNEGVHIPRVNAVILLRTTSSKIIYLQQIGRCLTAEKKDKPIILDMVDNITTTNIVHDIKEGFDWYAHQQPTDSEEREPREPKEFVVYDYTLGIRQAIEKLVPEYRNYTFEERLAIVTAFCEEHGRLPFRSDGTEIYLHCEALRRYCYDRQEVVELFNRFDGKMIDFEKRIEKLQRFIDNKGRLPKEKSEPEEYCNWKALWHRHIYGNRQDERLQAIFDKYAKKKYSDDELLQRFIDFVEKNGRLPRSNSNAPKEELSLRTSVRNRLGNHPLVKEALREYGRKDMFSFEERLKRLEEFVSKEGRLPKMEESDEYLNLCRLRTLNKTKHDAKMTEILDEYGVKIMTDEVLKKEVLGFYDKHGRLPSNQGNERSLCNIFKRRKSLHTDPDIVPLLNSKLSSWERRQKNCDDRVKQQIIAFVNEHHRLPKYSVKGNYEYNLTAQWRERCDRICADDPQMQAIRDQYEVRPPKFEERYARVRDWSAEHGRLPRRTDKDDGIYHDYIALRDTYRSTPEVQSLLKKYGSVLVTRVNLDARLDQIESFADEYGRLPTTSRSNEVQLGRWWVNLKRRYGTHPRVTALKERFPIQNRK